MNGEEAAKSRAADDAAEWVIRLMHDPSAKAQEEFAEWCADDPGHFEVFQAMRQTWRDLDRLEGQLPASPGQLSRGAVVELLADRKPGPLLRWLSERSELQARRARLRRAGGWSVAAALCFLAMGYAAMVWSPWAVDRYATPVGSQQTIKLSDGSIVQLNTRSRVEVRFANDVRDVRLVEGEALFSVAHDSQRPFLVTTDNARVRAIGTKFNVYRQSSGKTRVAVLEGVVQASAMRSAAADAGSATPREVSAAGPGIRLEAGGEATILGEDVDRAVAADVQRAVAWQRRKLVFDSARVDEIAAEFNRYNRTQIVVLDEAIGSRRMAGTFEADDPSPLLGYFARDPGVVISREGAEIRITSKGQP